MTSVVFENKTKPPQDYTPFTELTEKAQEVNKAFSVGQDVATVTLPVNDNSPAFIVPEGDEHYGSIYADYSFQKWRYNFIMNHDGWYSIKGGDDEDLFNHSLGKTAQGMYGNVLTPTQQIQSKEAEIASMDKAGKLLARTIGNHQRFIGTAGLSFGDTFLRDASYPIFTAGGLLIVRFGTQEYKIAFNHSFNGNSKKNPCNAAKNLIDQEYGEADIALLFHTHVKATEHCFRGGKERTLAICGTDKVFDHFGMEMGYGHAHQGGVVIAIWPDEHLMSVFYKMHEVIKLLNIKDDETRK